MGRSDSAGMSGWEEKIPCPGVDRIYMIRTTNKPGDLNIPHYSQRHLIRYVERAQTLVAYA